MDQRLAKSRPASLEQALRDLARGGEFALAPRGRAFIALAVAIGPLLARRIVRMERDGVTCRVVVQGARSAAAVELHAPRILAAMREVARSDAPARLDVTVAPDPATGAECGPGRRPESPSAAADLPGAMAALRAIEEPEVRRRLARWMRVPVPDD